VVIATTEDDDGGDKAYEQRAGATHDHFELRVTPSSRHRGIGMAIELHSLLRSGL